MPSDVEHAFKKAELRDRVKAVIKEASCIDGICQDRLTPAEIGKAVQEALAEAIKELEASTWAGR